MAKIVWMLALGMLTAGCNTVEGFGKDVNTLGSKIEKTAKDVKK